MEAKYHKINYTTESLEEELDIIHIEVKEMPSRTVRRTRYTITVEDGRQFTCTRDNMLICTDHDILDENGNYLCTDTEWHTPEQFMAQQS